MDQQNPLDEEMRLLEASARGFDEGDVGEAVRIAESLWRIFHQSPASTPCLSRMGATYARVSSSVPKPPHPQNVFLALVNVTIELNAFETQVVQTTISPPEPLGSPRFTPVLGKVREFRSVQAPDWWKNEPVFIIDHSRVTRKDLALWAVCRNGELPEGEKLPRVYEAIQQGKAVSAAIPMANGAVVNVPFRDAHLAALRQMAYEVLRSPELLKLAGRGRK